MDSEFTDITLGVIQRDVSVHVHLALMRADGTGVEVVMTHGLAFELSQALLEVAEIARQAAAGFN